MPVDVCLPTTDINVKIVGVDKYINSVYTFYLVIKSFLIEYQTLEVVGEFNYLGRVSDKLDDNWSELYINLKRVSNYQ